MINIITKKLIHFVFISELSKSIRIASSELILNTQSEQNIKQIINTN